MGDTALIHEELQALGITPNYKGYSRQCVPSNWPWRRKAASAT